jgi:hypothetical protein
MEDKTPVLLYSLTNPTIGFVDPSHKVGFTDPTELKNVTIFGKKVKPVSGFKFKVFRDCYKEHGTWA